MSEVLGRTVHLDGGRLVFLGTSKEMPDTLYVGFRSAEGKDLKFTLSREAFAALVEMATNPMHGMPLRDFPHRSVWQVVAEWKEVESNHPLSPRP